VQRPYGEGACAPPVLDGGGFGACTPPLVWSGPPALPWLPPLPELPFDGGVEPPLGGLVVAPPPVPPEPLPVEPVPVVSVVVVSVVVGLVIDGSFGIAGGCVGTCELDFDPLLLPPLPRTAATTITNRITQAIATSRRRQ
jgi:hypothetical protein